VSEITDKPGHVRWAGDAAGYWTLVDSIDEGFCVMEVVRAGAGDADYRFVEANGAFEQLTGLRETRGRGLRGLSPPNVERWFEALGRIASTGEPVRFKAPAGATGGVLDVHAFRFGARESKRVAALLRGVTPDRSADEQLREAERLSYVLHGSSQGFWDWNFASGRVEFSRTFASMLGYELAELAPSIETWKALVHPDDLVAVTARAQASKRADPAAVQYDDEYRVRHKDGRWVWVQVRGRVVERDTSGGAVRAAGTCLDITARRQADEALRVALAENEKLVAELREALQRVRTLSGLVPICMFCKKIRDDQGYWERIEKYISTHTDALVSHGLCPECLATHYPEASE